MKRKIISVLLALTIFGISVQAYSILLEFDIGAQTATLNGEVIDAPSYLSERGNTMVGLRAVAQTLGVSVEWNQESREVILKDDGLEMKVLIDSDIAVVNGTPVTIAEPAVIYDDRTMVPVRFISEGFGAVVFYEEETSSVLVTAKTFIERCADLKEAAQTLIKQYPQTLQGWISTTDEKVSPIDFIKVWDSMVNTKIMELLSGRIVTEEICEKYRNVSKVSFYDVFNFDGVYDIYAEINESIRVFVNTGYKSDYISFKYDPSMNTIKTLKQSSTSGGIGVIGGSGGGGAATSGSVGTIAGSASSSTGSTVLPTAPMPGAAESIPPYKPTDNDSEPIIKDYTPEYNPTPEPTPQITEGPEGKDNHFNDMIDGL